MKKTSILVIMAALGLGTLAHAEECGNFAGIYTSVTEKNPLVIKQKGCEEVRIVLEPNVNMDLIYSKDYTYSSFNHVTQELTQFSSYFAGFTFASYNSVYNLKKSEVSIAQIDSFSLNSKGIITETQFNFISETTDPTINVITWNKQ